MKVSYLHIRNYKQFSDLELELTYPKGHEKAGKPLDKICIIGQSGTGKTNLLDIFKKSTIDFSQQPKDSYLPFSEFVGKDTDDKYITTKFQILKGNIAETLFTENESYIHGELEFLDNEQNYFVGTDKNINPKLKKQIFNKEKISNTDITLLDSLAKERKDIESLGISYYGGLDNFTKKITEVDINIEKLKNKYMSSPLEHLKFKNFIDRNIVNINESNNSWKLLKANIDNYKTEKKQYENKLFREVRKNPKNAEKMVKAIEEWEKENENILDKIADDINSIITKFNLELQLDEDTQSYEELKIKDLSNNIIIEYDVLSTGTKNLLSTFIPLKSYKPKDSIILIDEPEMSFYPDIQRQLVELYTNAGENNQLIIATHSPLIASSFEPWEVVELKFNKNNQIYREKYYDGENDIDNYTLDPRMLTWTGILTDIFDIKEDSNFTFREEKLMEYATLKSEIKQMKSQEEKVKAFEKLKKVSKILGIYNR